MANLEKLRAIAILGVDCDGFGALDGPTVDVLRVASGAEALTAMASRDADILILDVDSPEACAEDVKRAVGKRRPELPLILLSARSGAPATALAHGLTVVRELRKPVTTEMLRHAVTEAAAALLFARSRGTPASGVDRPALAAAFGRALDTLHMAYQPLVRATTRETIGHEALMRTREPSLPHPGKVLEAAEKLGGLHRLGRTTRQRVSEQLASTTDGGDIFVNLHSADLADPELYSDESPLAPYAKRIVLEITERASLEGIPDPAARIDQLRAAGYRVAVDDLGAGYAGLNYFASLRPDIAKIDMSLTRGVDKDPVRERVVRSLVSLCRELGMLIVAEGVETVGERDVLVGIGCDYLQGYLLARPGAPFPAVSW